MKRQFLPLLLTLGLVTVLLPILPHSAARAADETAGPPEHIKAALELWHIVSPQNDKDIFTHTPFTAATGPAAPLARYKPENAGAIEIGMNLRQYRRDYAFLSSNQDMAEKPDFEHYLTVLTALSLANESAHIRQKEANSLDDFYTFIKNGQLGKACALYAHQQHISDIVMLQFAYRAELFFLGHGATKGLNALRIALEKNDLRDEYEEFRESLKQQNSARLMEILSLIKAKRATSNMSSLTFCGNHKGEATLDEDIIERASLPAQPLLLMQQDNQHANSPQKKESVWNRLFSHKQTASKPQTKPSHTLNP